MITIVAGLAGSGKTTYVKSVASDYEFTYYHDEWVNHQYKAQCVQSDIAMLLGCDPSVEDFKAEVQKQIYAKSELNVILANYFCSKYACLLASLTEWKPMHIAECPFLDENIKALKTAYPHRVTIKWMDTSHHVIGERLRARGWDQNRIDFSIKMQSKQFLQYGNIIDEYI